VLMVVIVYYSFSPIARNVGDSALGKTTADHGATGTRHH
jgi:hypothetical protein